MDRRSYFHIRIKQWKAFALLGTFFRKFKACVSLRGKDVVCYKQCLTVKDDEERSQTSYTDHDIGTSHCWVLIGGMLPMWTYTGGLVNHFNYRINKIYSLHSKIVIFYYVSRHDIYLGVQHKLLCIEKSAIRNGGTSGNGGNHFLSFTVRMELEYLFQNHMASEIITMSIQLGGTNRMTFLLDTIIHQSNTIDRQ